MNAWQRLTSLLLLVVAVLASGCGAMGNKPCAVTGKVTVNGKAAAGLYVAFLPTDPKPEQPPTLARTAKDGTFSLQVPAPGEYAVNAYWPEVIDIEGDRSEGKDLFKNQFRDPARPVSKPIIVLGNNALSPIELKSDLIEQ